MSITGLSFLFIFFPVVIVLYYNPIIKNRTFKNILLLLASLGFYTCIEPTMVLVLFLTIFVNYFGVKLFIKTDKNVFRIIIIVFDFVLLLGFKYINNFFQEYKFITESSVDFPDVVMPLGVSYYTFNAISYVVDSTRSKNAGNILDTSLYISFFGKISSGPIVQYNNMISEIKSRKESLDSFCVGFQRFGIGLIKKVLIADSLSNLVSTCFDNFSGMAVSTAWIGAIAYTLQLYFDFSGCTDIAIGIGNIFGFNFVENFNYPYTAISISDFWKRWHISLTKWFTKYIYIPLGGNRVSKSRNIFNIFVVWLFTGIWHGANWTFIVWGLLYCIFLLLEKFTSLKCFLEKHKAFGHIYTLLIVCLLWVMFRANSVSDAVSYIGNMFGIGATSFFDSTTKELISNCWITLLIGAVFALPIMNKIYISNKKAEKVAKAIFTIVILVLSVVAICVCITNGASGSVSLYANF